MNLLEPGDTPHDNMQFLFFFTATLRAVFKHQDLLRVSIASAGNDHRLGANEAPPAIISAYIGEQLEDIINQLLSGGLKDSMRSGLLGLGTPVLPELPKHAGDRNRTSPFAFTGNKFEFRAVASSQSVSFPTVVLNTIVCEAIDELCTELEGKLDSADFETALKEVLVDSLKETRTIVFNGDGYSQEWQDEAAQRGLLNLRTTPDALPYLTSKKNIDLFGKYRVLNELEVESRYEIWAEQYVTTLTIEVDTTEAIAKTMVYPAAVRYLNELADAVKKTADLGLKNSGATQMLERINSALNELGDSLANLEDVQSKLKADSTEEHCFEYKNEVIPAMNRVRDAVDLLERYSPDDYWPLPVYREMLFVK
jgi:glutamine synthetase